MVAWIIMGGGGFGEYVARALSFLLGLVLLISAFRRRQEIYLGGKYGIPRGARPIPPWLGKLLLVVIGTFLVAVAVPKIGGSHIAKMGPRAFFHLVIFLLSAGAMIGVVTPGATFLGIPADATPSKHRIVRFFAAVIAGTGLVLSVAWFLGVP